MRKKNCNGKYYILSDADTPSEFVKSIESTTKRRWIVLEKRTTVKMPKWRRKLIAYLFTFKFMCSHRRASEVLAWQQMFGILPAFYNRYIFHRKRLRINIMTFIYKPKKGIAGKLYHWLVSSAVSSRNVDNIFVFAESEVEHYSGIFPKAKEKFHFVRLGIPIDDTDYTDVTLKNEEYFFATGASNRDYDFLINVFNGLNYKLKIACPNIHTKVSSNIELLDKCFRTDMKRYMFNSVAVLIPLKDLNVSSGQLVFINAMQMGKPIIITDSAPTRSYLENGVDAILLPNDVEIWRQTISRLIGDKDMYERMSVNNRHRGYSDFSVAGLGEKIGHLIVESL